MKFPVQSLYGFYRNAVRNPRYRWWIILGTLVYLLSPFDISPDFLPILGEVDDFVLVSMLLTEVSSLAFEKFKSRSSGVLETENSTTQTNPAIEVKAVSLD
jgi:uncharacterized membrane protein YkvA (DUF1232 family)